MSNNSELHQTTARQQVEFPSWWHHDPVEILAVHMEESFFAPHELPVGRERHEKFREAARAAIGVLRGERDDRLAQAHDLLWRGHSIGMADWSDKSVLWCGDVERYFSDQR